MDEQITYRGFEANGREVEVFLGEAFETHLPLRDEVIFRSGGREVRAAAGDVIVRRLDGSFYVEGREMPEIETNVDDLTDAGVREVLVDLGFGHLTILTDQLRGFAASVVSALDRASPDWPQKVLGLPGV